MSTAILLNGVYRNIKYPVSVEVSAPECCGTVSLLLDMTQYTDQMIHELPSITIDIYVNNNGTYSLFDTRALNIRATGITNSITTVMDDIPLNCTFKITPNFDEYAIVSHNNTAEMFQKDLWTTPTEYFPVTLIWDNSDVTSNDPGSSGGSSGGSTSVNTMPEPSESLEGAIKQYTGDTDINYHNGYFYKCVKSGDSYIWQEIPVQSGTVGSGSAKLTEPLSPTISLGGILQEDTFETGTDIEALLRTMLTPYVAPTVIFTTDPVNPVYQKGELIRGIQLTAKVIKGSKDIMAVNFIVGNRKYPVTDTITDGGIFTYTCNTISINTTVGIEINDGVNTITETKEIKFVLPHYFGISESNTLTSSILSSFDSILTDTDAPEYSYTANNEYIYYVYDNSLPDLSEILDDGRLNNLLSFTKTTFTKDSEIYKVYISNTPVTCTEFKYTFK